ncbi:MAG: hypothetical protein FJ167_08265 [Gammaproteobacteria bacterium]|nr:hypothetical protein [Gammaproteobacteria bacterium]
METVIRYTKDEATGEFTPFVVEFENDYLAYEGGEVWFSFTDIKVGQIEDSDHFGYQWTCSYENHCDGWLDAPRGWWTRLSRQYDTLADAKEALWASLTEKERYAEILNFVTDGEQTLEQLGLFLPDQAIIYQ